MTTKYTVQYTEMVPGGELYRQSDIVHGDLEAVRCYFDRQSIWAADPIVVTEHTQSDGLGRVVPASEWDICEE